MLFRSEERVDKLIVRVGYTRSDDRRDHEQSENRRQNSEHYFVFLFEHRFCHTFFSFTNIAREHVFTRYHGNNKKNTPYFQSVLHILYRNFRMLQAKLDFRAANG